MYKNRLNELSNLVLAVPVGLASMASLNVRQARPSFVLMLVAAWIAGLGAQGWRRHALNTAVFVSSIGVISSLGGIHPGADLTYECLFTLSAMGLGALFARNVDRAAAERVRLVRATAEREEVTRQAVVTERSRMARELNDVVGHSVSAMTLQASGARLRLEQDDRAAARDALAAVEDLGHRALSDMRRMLGLLRDDTATSSDRPAPGLACLPDLAADLRAAGLRVEVSATEINGELPLVIDVAAYRLIEAALGLALSARAVAATVAVSCAAGQVELEVRDCDRKVEPAPTAEAALRHRVEIYNGSVEITDGNDRGRTLRARLPLKITAR